MELRMKNFSIIGVHWKILFLVRGGGGGGGDGRKTNIEGGELSKKGVLGQFEDLRE